MSESVAEQIQKLHEAMLMLDKAKGIIYKNKDALPDSQRSCDIYIAEIDDKLDGVIYDLQELIAEARMQRRA